MEMNVGTVERYATMLGDLAVQFGSNLLVALLVLMIGLWIIKRILKLFDLAMAKKKLKSPYINF